jgi:uncharacterized protein YifN (PemK superfamily)
MPIQEHPAPGTILICDFSGMKEPEMVKRRPVIVLSPKIVARKGLCTVVAVSTTPPAMQMPYHMQLSLPAPLSNACWLKGDMVYAMAFQRLDFVRLGKGLDGRRIYLYKPLPAATLNAIRCCVLHGLGLSALTKPVP